jgi:hypothetical protein
MDGFHAALLLAIAVGIVSAGIAGSAWRLALDEELRIGALLDPYPTLITPFRVLAVVFAAPMIVIMDAFWWLIEKPIFGVPLMAAGLFWSFIQGVFILTQVFGFT